MRYPQFMLIDWIKAGLEKPGKTKAGLAKALGVHPSAVTRMLKHDGPETRRIQASELSAISEYLGEPIPELGLTYLRPMEYDQFPILIHGIISPGVWRESAASQLTVIREHSYFPPDPRFDVGHQFDMIVEGTSINRFARHGSLLRCVDIAKAGIVPEPDDYVIVERSRAGMIETSAKKYHPTSAGLELLPDSDDPRWQEPLAVAPADLERGDIKITAVVIYAYAPSLKRAKLK
jgi:hypothetical protein